MFNPCYMLAAMLMCHSVFAQTEGRVVHLAKLQIDPAQLESYKAAVKEEIGSSVRIEPGVLIMDAVAEKTTRQISRSSKYTQCCRLQSAFTNPHFKKYKNTSKNMVKALELIDVNPVFLETKSR